MESGDHRWRTHGVHRARICHFTVRKKYIFRSQGFWSRTATRRSGLVAHERTNNSWPALHALLIFSAASLRQLSAHETVLWSCFRVILILLVHCESFWKQHFEEQWKPHGESQNANLLLTLVRMFEPSYEGSMGMDELFLRSGATSCSAVSEGRVWPLCTSYLRHPLSFYGIVNSLLQ